MGSTPVSVIKWVSATNLAKSADCKSVTLAVNTVGSSPTSPIKVSISAPVMHYGDSDSCGMLVSFIDLIYL